jgi:hypothetical protein
VQSLIGYIAQRHSIVQRENLATEILVYILDHAGSMILHQLLTHHGVLLEPGLQLCLKPQRRGNQGRWIPDIQVLDETRKCRALIESKFQARITPHQRKSYLSELKGGGQLLFVVPEARKQEVLQAFPSASHRDKLKVVSWDAFLDALKVTLVGKTLQSSEITAADRVLQRQRELLSDVEQLGRYCEVIKKQTFDPLSKYQIEGPTLSEPIHQLTWITAELIEKCKEQKLVCALKKQKKPEGRLEDDDHSLYFGLSLEFCGALIWIGLWIKMWREQRDYCTTPLWIWLCDSDEADKEVGPKARSKAREIAKRLAEARIHLTWVAAQQGWVIPICLTPGIRQEEVVEEAVDFVRNLHELVCKVSVSCAHGGVSRCVEPGKCDRL